MFTIVKQFKFDAGHRVYTQKLNSQLALTSECACKHLHGHEFKVEVALKSQQLDIPTQMVTDFKHLTWFKKLLDDVFDHSFILDIDDPFTKLYYNEIIRKHVNTISALGIPKSNPTKGDVIQVNPEAKIETFKKLLKTYFVITLLPQDESFISDVGVITLIDSVPTAENLAKLFYEILTYAFSFSIRLKQTNVIEVEYVKVWETSKSYAIYRSD